MVIKAIKDSRFLILTLGLFLFAASSLALAKTTLNATVDRNQIYEMDTLNLSIEGELDVDFSFGGLMNFGINQSERPDTSAIERDFEILDSQQSYNMQSVNGESKAKVLWRYTLAPKSAGVLEIPEITFKDAQTNAIPITVIAGKAPKNSSEPPAVFLEAEVDKNEAYVQEQILYTLRLYTQGLINGELSDPKSEDAIIEVFGDQKKYYRMVYNQRYEVIERQYLIYPQRSGELTIDEQVFQGISLKHGRRARLRDASDKVSINVKTPPASFSGRTWLPAMSLNLSEQWQGDPENVLVGDNLTRKITLSALGLLGSGLPPISMGEHKEIKLYTDKPLLETQAHEAGAQAKRTDSFAIVALKEGVIELPEIRIPWWDTVNDVEREAVIPERRLSISKNPALISHSGAVWGQDSARSLEGDFPVDLRDPLSGIQSSNEVTVNSTLWQVVSALLLIGWLSTSYIFFKKIRRLEYYLSALPLPTATEDASEKQRFEQAVTALRAGDKNLVQHVAYWMAFFHTDKSNDASAFNLQRIRQLDQSIYAALEAFESGLYGAAHNSQAYTSAVYDKERLLEALKHYRQEQLSKKIKDDSSGSGIGIFKEQTLEPFYK